MCLNLLPTATLLAVFLRFDRDLAEKTRQDRCPECQGPLHVANYLRKPRGGLAVVERDTSLRFSFCCGREGCRRRVTPQSIRFLGRRVYFAFVVLLVGVLHHGPDRRRLEQLRGVLAVSRRTLERWREWWLSVMPRKPFWTIARARFVPPLDEFRLPLSLVEKFGPPETPASMQCALEFMLPLTSP